MPARETQVLYLDNTNKVENFVFFCAVREMSRLLVNHVMQNGYRTYEDVKLNNMETN